MDWALAIARNREALIRIVAGLIAMAGLGGAATLPRSLRNAVYRLLRPAESAARRLIVIAARGVARHDHTPLWPAGDSPRSMAGRPEGSPLPRAPAFALFDPPKRFAWLKPKTVPGFGPRISLPGLCDPVFLPAIVLGPGDPVPATRLFRRLAALQAALADIPRQARRLARRQALRAGPRPEAKAQRPLRGEAAVRSPLRPGSPPGRRRRPTHEVDAVLAECHALALDALDTS